MFKEDVDFLLPVLSFHLSCIDSCLYCAYKPFHFAIIFSHTVMFNSVVFHVVGKFVAVEGWTVVCFPDVGISESIKNCVYFLYFFRYC